MDSLPELWPGFTYLPHQEMGVRWMLNKEKDGTIIKFSDEVSDETRIFGGVQADEMGLGKTMQMIATMRANPKSRNLVLAPVALLETWICVLVRAGFQVYYPTRKSYSPVSLWSLHPTCGKATIVSGAGMVFVANYEKTIWNPHLFKYPYGRIIIDEAHKISNEGSRISHAVMAIKAEVRWAMTGTPVVNSWGDLRSILQFLGVPGAVLPKKSELAKSEKYLYRVGMAVIHRTMESLRGVISAAPPKPIIHKKVLDFVTDEEKRFYRSIQGTIETVLGKSGTEEVENGDMPGWKFQLYMRLRQISVHPQVYIKARRGGAGGYAHADWIHASTKFEALANIIREERAKPTAVGDKKPRYLVFCQFCEEMALLESYLTKLDGIGLKVACFEGGMTDKQRTRVLSMAKTEADCFLIQLQAGGCGLNLQEFNRVIFMGPWWTQALMDQAIARAVRIGQTDVVHVYYLVLAEEKTINIDLEMLEKAQMKKQILEHFFRHVDNPDWHTEEDNPKDSE